MNQYVTIVAQKFSQLVFRMVWYAPFDPMCWNSLQLYRHAHVISVRIRLQNLIFKPEDGLRFHTKYTLALYNATLM